MSIYYFEKNCDLGRLTVEIQQSAITIALNHLNLDGISLEVHFNADLPAEDETILEALVEAHVNTPLDNNIQIVELEHLTDDSGIPKIAIYEPEGVFSTYVTHDFCDKTSWYSYAAEVVEEPLTVDGLNDKLYTFAYPNIIDLTHGKVTKEDNFGCAVIVKEGDTILTEGFELDYASGSILFEETPSGYITANYYYSTGSSYVVTPPFGKKLILRHAEVQFTADVRMKETYFDIYAYNPNDLPNKVLVERVVYKNVKDLLNVSNLAFTVPAFHDLTDALMVFPFDYSRAIILKDSVGAELRISTKDDEPYTKSPSGDSLSFATVSLYCAVEQE